MRIRLASERGRTVAKDSIYNVHEVHEVCTIHNGAHPISIFIATTNRDVHYRADHRDSYWMLLCISAETYVQSGPAHHMDVLGGA